ncbi:MAG TPA: tRNA glutamyl-Q(34) synthetase GluQRS, partial [Burkholderiales bacterium]|nr:tRNA glutamyl-Q(34) synthetase GluQRS [Burkholderiales bacterium]
QPRYLHLPVAVNEAGEKLSKQTRAESLDCARPAPALAGALRFLGQDPPEDLAVSRPADILSWAMENWRSERIPRARHLAVPL